MNRLRILLLLCLCTMLLGASAPSFDVRILFATLGLGSIVAGGKYLIHRDRMLLRFEARVDGALWGPEDPTGKRQLDAGVVAVVNRLGSDLPRAITAAELAATHAQTAATAAQSAAQHAATAAAAAQTAQALLLTQAQPLASRRGDHDH